MIPNDLDSADLVSVYLSLPQQAHHKCCNTVAQPRAARFLTGRRAATTP